MKKASLFFVLLCAIFSMTLVSCSKDDDGDDFDYPMDELYGKWEATEILSDGTWYDVTRYPYTQFGMDIIFYKDGKFYGSGYFGNGYGTYKVSGKTIQTYFDGEPGYKYTVNSLTIHTADLTMSYGGSSLRMKAQKVY